MSVPAFRISQLRALEAEAIFVIREVAAELGSVLLFSGGKDSIALLRPAEKAFRPLPLPFAVLHVDTRHNFREVIEFRDRRLREAGHRRGPSSAFVRRRRASTRPSRRSCAPAPQLPRRRGWGSEGVAWPARE